MNITAQLYSTLLNDYIIIYSTLLPYYMIVYCVIYDVFVFIVHYINVTEDMRDRTWQRLQTNPLAADQWAEDLRPTERNDSDST